MSDIDAMLAERASQSGEAPSAADASSIDALLNQRAGGASVATTAPAAATKPSTVFERFKSGLADVPVGITQLATHLMPEPTVSPQERAAYGVGPDEPLESFDTVVVDREKAYQAGRAAAGSTGFDWVRTAGNVANPINYAVPGSGASGVLGRIAGAGLQGAAVASLNPVTEPGNFWGGKLWQAGVGGAMGTLVGGAAEALSKPFSWAARGVRNMLGGPSVQQADAAAQGVIDQTLSAGGIKTTDLPPEMVDGVRAQIRSAMETGGTVDPVSLKAQAEAASLPIPVKLSVAQASGDPARYATEQELAKIQGQGPNPLLQIFGENNQKLIDNLGALGADGAPTTREAGTQGLLTLAKIDQQMDQAKNAAYNVVRDSQGRSATLDAEHFYMNAQAALERDNVTAFVPKEIAKMYEDYTEGRMPLTVDTMTAFDKVLSRAQRTLTDGNEIHAVGLIRSSLHDTPVSSAEGAQAVQAYNYARGLARQQFQLADPKSQSFVPGYASMLKGMGDADHGTFIAALEKGTANLDPEKWFSDNLVKGTPAGVKKLMGFLNQGGDDAQPTIQTLQHGMMGDIRDSVVKGNDEVGRSVFSNLAMGKVMDRADTLRQILPGDTVDALGRLYNTSSRISGVPYKSAVNWSNTAAASANMQALKEGAGTVGRIVAPRGAAALDVATDIGKRRAARAAALEATQPLYATPGIRGRAAASGAVSLSALLAGRDQSGEQ